MYMIIDGHTFRTAEGAEMFYRDRRATHTGDWDIWLIEDEAYKIHLEVHPDVHARNLFDLILLSELLPEEEEEAREECEHRSKYIERRDEERECCEHDPLDEHQAEEAAFYCALYDIENNMAEGRSFEELQDEYMSMPSEELLHQYETKYDEKPLMYERQNVRRRQHVRAYGARIKEE